MQRPDRIILTPSVYCRLRHMAVHSANEIAAWGIAEDPAQPLLVTDLFLPLQTNDPCYVEMDDDSINKHLCDSVMGGLSPEQVMRIWIHTHPGSSPTPSGHDNHTFNRLLETMPWIVMFIMAESGAVSATHGAANGHGITRTSLKIQTDFSGSLWEHTGLITPTTWTNIINAVENAGTRSPYREPAPQSQSVWPKARKKTPSLAALGINEASIGRWWHADIDDEETSCFTDDSPSPEDPTPAESVINELYLSPDTHDDELPPVLAGLEDYTLLELHNLNEEEREFLIDTLWALYIGDDSNAPNETLDPEPAQETTP